MLKIKQYVKVQSLEEAYELNQKKTARVLGGMMWLRLSNRTVGTVIDLSGLGLDTIEETEEEFRIGCMTSLRTLETDEGLNQYTNGAMRESLRHIEGVQFRNGATLGGSIFGRYGYSDVLTMFLSLDTTVELYHAGLVPLTEFITMKKDRDILVRIIVKKTPVRCYYASQRSTATDFPVLTCAVSLADKTPCIVLGARPFAARRMEDPEGILTGFASMSAEEKQAAITSYGTYLREHVHTDSNMRGSAEYRAVLAEVFTRRGLSAVGGMTNEH